MKRRDRLSVAVKPVIEGLEARRLLATQQVFGTAGDDVILIAQDGGDPTQLDITTNGSETTVPVMRAPRSIFSRATATTR